MPGVVFHQELIHAGNRLGQVLMNQLTVRKWQRLQTLDQRTASLHEGDVSRVGDRRKIRPMLDPSGGACSHGVDPVGQHLRTHFRSERTLVFNGVGHAEQEIRQGNLFPNRIGKHRN